MRSLVVCVACATAAAAPARAGTLSLSRSDYEDRVHAVWAGQIAACIMGWQFEHRVAAVRRYDDYPVTTFFTPNTHVPVDDDWYYEMCAVRAFEKHGVGMTAAQLGDQWLENSCGTWGSSEQALLALKRGVRAPDCGHPRHNKLWFTIGPQFSSELYGALAPGRPNLAAKLAREFGHVNGYAEAVDGAVFMAGMVSIAFAEKDCQQVVRKAARLIHPDSPYRQCLDLVVSLAEAGKSSEEVFAAVEDRWHIEYPATNNAVPNGGIVAAAVWFGRGDFLATVNLVTRAADFTDADCNAASAGAVIGAMHGTAGIPRHLVSQMRDKIAGTKMGELKLTPPVDESITGLAKRTTMVGMEMLAKRGGATVEGDTVTVTVEEPETHPAELFKLADLTKFWNPDWSLDRAGFGGAGGGMPGIRGITHLDGDVLATYPRDEVRGTVLRRTVELGANPVLTFWAGVDPGRAWDLRVYADDRQVLKQMVAAPANATGRHWEDVRVDLAKFAGKPTHLRLYQLVLVGPRTAGNAYWKDLRVQ